MSAHYFGEAGLYLMHAKVVHSSYMTPYLLSCTFIHKVLDGIEASGKWPSELRKTSDFLSALD